MMIPPVRPEIRGLTPYLPGKPRAEVERELGLRDVVKLASNENPLGPSPLAVQAVRTAVQEAHIYPEATAPELRQALAEGLGLAPDWLLVGNGSDEVFRLLALTYLGPGTAAVAPAPSFPTYGRVVRTAGAELAEVPLKDGAMDLLAMANAARKTPNVRMVFLCRPNNPTGGVFPAREFPAFMASLPAEVLVVLDEAYHEYDDSGFDAIACLNQHPNLVVTRTFSKAYGLAALRVGYGAARPAVWKHVWAVREPFSVNGIAQAAALAALRDTRHLARSVAENRAGRQELYALCDQLGLTCIPSEANFVLMDLGREARPVYESLLRKGVIVRPGDTFGLPTTLRVSVGTGRELQRFAAALREALRS